MSRSISPTLVYTICSAYHIIICLEVPKNISYKAFKKSQQFIRIGTVLTMLLLPILYRKIRQKKYFYTRCLPSAGFEPARVQTWTYFAGWKVLSFTTAPRTSPNYNDPLQSLNTRLKDFNRCDQIKYIYLTNGRNFPHFSKWRAGPVDTTTAFQPGHPGSIPTRGVRNLGNYFFSLLLLILSVRSLYRIACGRIKPICM